MCRCHSINFPKSTFFYLFNFAWVDFVETKASMVLFTVKFLEISSFKQFYWLADFNRASCFLAWARKLKIKKSSVKTSESLLNFSDLWNQNMQLKIHTLRQTDFILFSNGLSDIYRISSNKRPRRLLHFETVRCGAY